MPDGLKNPLGKSTTVNAVIWFSKSIPTLVELIRNTTYSYCFVSLQQLLISPAQWLSDHRQRVGSSSCPDQWYVTLIQTSHWDPLGSWMCDGTTHRQAFLFRPLLKLKTSSSWPIQSTGFAVHGKALTAIVRHSLPPSTISHQQMTYDLYSCHFTQD